MRTDENIVEEKDLNLLYTELCKSYHAVRRFRLSLLGFLPLASGSAIGLLVNFDHNLSWHNIVALGFVGLLVNIGLGVYEIHNVKRCKALIVQGAALEEILSKGQGGQFVSHPAYDKKEREIKKDMVHLHIIAAFFVYFAVFIGWIYFISLGLCLRFSV